MGKPVVAYDLPETRVSADRAALYARPNDVAEFAQCIATLMDSPGLRRQMGDHGRMRIQEHRNWQHSALELVRAYRCLGAGTRKYVG